MKKIITILIILIIISTLLLTYLYNNNKKEINKYEYNNIYYKTTNNYINDKLYSVRKETIKIQDGFLSYESNIKYTDSNVEQTNLKYIDTYTEKPDRIVTSSKTYYIDSKKLCLESIDCDSPFTVNNNNEVNNVNDFKIKNYLTTKKNISLSNDKYEVYVVLDKTNESKELKKYIEKIAYDLNVTFNIIEINKKIEQELIDNYQIMQYPAVLVFSNGKFISSNVGKKTQNETALYLFLLGIDYR